MVKVTFTLDDETVNRIRQASREHNKAQSQVVREAVAQYAAREQRLSEAQIRWTAHARRRRAV